MPGNKLQSALGRSPSPQAMLRQRPMRPVEMEPAVEMQQEQPQQQPMNPVPMQSDLGPVQRFTGNPYQYQQQNEGIPRMQQWGQQIAQQRQMAQPQMAQPVPMPRGGYRR